MQTQTGLENVQAVSPGMVEAGQFGYASETKTAESEEIRHSEQYVLTLRIDSTSMPRCKLAVDYEFYYVAFIHFHYYLYLGRSTKRSSLSLSLIQETIARSPCNKPS